MIAFCSILRKAPALTRARHVRNPDRQSNATIMKLVQKHLLKGTREFEIAEDMIHVRIRTPFKEEKLTVVLSMLNPEPAANGPWLEFHSRVKRHPLLTLYRDKPDPESFERFVDAIKRRAREEYEAFAGLRTGARTAGPAANSYEDPPEFGEPRKPRGKPVSIASIDSSIRMLREYMDIAEIDSLLEALEALKAAPENESSIDRLVTAFDELGPRQGAVLTYAPYITLLLSDDPFEHQEE